MDILDIVIMTFAYTLIPSGLIAIGKASRMNLLLVLGILWASFSAVSVISSPQAAFTTVSGIARIFSVALCVVVYLMVKPSTGNDSRGVNIVSNPVRSEPDGTESKHE